MAQIVSSWAASAVVAAELLLRLLGELGELALDAVLDDAGAVLVTVHQRLRDLLDHRRLGVWRGGGDRRGGDEIEQHRARARQRTVPSRANLVRPIHLDALEAEQP